MSVSDFRDTIYALSSGGLPSGIAVVRLSGPSVRTVLLSLTGGVPSGRIAVLRSIRDRNGFILDKGLILFFDGPQSFTGEDCGELHVHGGPAVVSAVLAALAEFEGLRSAEAGEFTRRAFVNGKLDLTRAEGLADLIAAETEAERRLAIDTTDGAQERLYTAWRERLLHARALIEADLDFSDEGDVEGFVAHHMWPELVAMAQEIDHHIEGYRYAEMVRDGFRVAIIGPPNVGKSSLLNALAGREAAIVTDLPGTTRDIVEVTLDLGGYKVLVKDTAGIRDSNDRIEQIGIERALAAARDAELVLELCDPTQPEVRKNGVLYDDMSRLKILTKADLLEQRTKYEPDFLISAHSGEGIDTLLMEIQTRAAAMLGSGHRVLPTRQRHVGYLQDCSAGLRRAAAIGAREPELGAEELRRSADALGRLTGATDVEDLLGAIFSTFCIGK